MDEEAQLASLLANLSSQRGSLGYPLDDGALLVQRNIPGRFESQAAAEDVVIEVVGYRPGGSTGEWMLLLD